MFEQHEAGHLTKLPEHIRLTIYQHAGVPTKTEIHLNRSSDILKAHPRLPWPPSLPRPPALSSSHALLLTCCLLYREVVKLIFTTNLIVLKPAEPNDLRLLSRLRPDTLKSLRRVTILLNSLSSLPHEACYRASGGHVKQRFGVNLYLDSADQRNVGTYASRSVSIMRPEDEDLLEEWQSAITWVLKHASPQVLSLHLICDCRDLKTARYISRPIWDSDTVLAECAMRLGFKDTQELGQEAAAAAQHAMRQFVPKGSFPFMRLPQEIQRQVLIFTDLVTPLREVEWAPRIGYTSRIVWDQCTNGEEPFCGQFHDICRYVNCWKSHHEHGCFCRRYHSAYSCKCRCWIPPASLFRVSRAFKEEVEAVFFRENNFVVRSKRGFRTAAKYTPRRTAPTIFFTSLAKNNLKYLRYLEIVFPPADYDYMRYSDPAYPEWINSIEFASDLLSLPDLTLFIVMADHEEKRWNATNFRCNVTPAQYDTIIKMYFRIIQPLRKFKEGGLRRFFVNLAWPYRWTEPHISRIVNNEITTGQEIENIERQVERAVMGEDYDSVAMGKKTIQRSSWMNDDWAEMETVSDPVYNSESENDLDE